MKLEPFYLGLELVSFYLSIYKSGNGASIYISIFYILRNGAGFYLSRNEANIYLSRNGAGMLDLTWLTGNTLLSCGYDTCARLWDTR